MAASQTAKTSRKRLRLRVLGSYFGLLGDLAQFLWARKLWWLVPIVLCLLVVAALVVLASSTPVSPFIYTLF